MGPLIQACEALLCGFRTIWVGNSPFITRPFRYSEALQRGSPDDHATHAHLTLLLSRQLGSDPEAESASQFRDVIAMLWLRPSHPREWGYFEEMRHGNIPTDVMPDWIKNAESIPHILEILRHLAEAQNSDPVVGPLWRTVAHEEDPHFVEAMQTFDRLMGMDCAEDDHRQLVNIVCKDLELAPYANLDRYFTPGRLESLALLKDLCLRVLVTCARGPDFLSPVAVPEAYSEARENSLARVAEYVYKRFSSTTSPASLRLLASLWPVASHETSLLENAMENTVSFDLLQRIFRYPVPCYGCLDGPGHLAFHLLSLAENVEFDREVTLFGKIPLKGRYMPVIVAIIGTLSDGEALSLAGYFPGAADRVLQILGGDIGRILSSQFDLLVMIWNTLEQQRLEFSEDIGAILIGIQKALQLPYNFRSTAVLAPLSLKIARLREISSARIYRTIAERDVINDEANATRRLVLSTLAIRSIFGPYNRRQIACARAVGDSQPALGWLKPYGG